SCAILTRHTLGDQLNRDARHFTQHGDVKIIHASAKGVHCADRGLAFQRFTHVFRGDEYGYGSHTVGKQQLPHLTTVFDLTYTAFHQPETRRQICWPPAWLRHSVYFDLLG